MEIKKERFRKTVTSPFTGQEYAIRRIEMRDYLRHVGVLPIGMATGVQERLAKLVDDLKSKSEDPDLEKLSRRYILERGVVEPKIWFGPEAECPEDALQYEDMGDDAGVVATEIVSMSFGLGVSDMEKFFRGPGTGAARPDGEEVRGEAIDPPAEENVH